MTEKCKTRDHCPDCGARVVLDKQDNVLISGAHHTERIEACSRCCGWYGETRFFRSTPGGVIVKSLLAGGGQA